MKHSVFLILCLIILLSPVFPETLRIEKKDGSFIEIDTEDIDYIDFDNLSVEDYAVLPSILKSLKNYPNPFNPHTVIEFELPEKSEIKAEIYNINGQKIRTLFTGIKNKGTVKLSWDGKNSDSEKVSAGIYFCRIETGGKEYSKKMIMIK